MSTHAADLRRISWPDFPHVAATINALVDAVRRQRPISSPTVKASVTEAGTSYQATPPRSASIIHDPFETYATSALEVTVKSGRIHWHDLDLDMADSAAIAIPANSTAHFIWIDLVAEFAPTTPIFGNGTSFPAQANAPARRYLKLASVASNATAVTEITLIWHGGDIIWPAPFGFWK